MSVVSLFAIALGCLTVLVGGLTLAVPFRDRRAGTALSPPDPGVPPPDAGDGGPFEVDGETLVRGFTLVVLGLVCLLFGVVGL